MLTFLGAEKKFTCRTLSEAHTLAQQLAAFCPNPTVAVIGLKELLINAVEHGCLNISYDEKTKLMESDDNAWEEEVEHRMLLPENKNKQVCVCMAFHEEEIHFVIKDPGRGFDWLPFLQFESVGPTIKHGRGIALAVQVSFQQVLYRGSGNEVLAIIRTTPPISD
ncbi:MAG: ATP-binding protein [Magnetococcales bacterium]|nr:ATP-binding protein [Magnetococcales bacterium]